MPDTSQIHGFGPLSRRAFIGLAAAAAATPFLPRPSLADDPATVLPMGSAPAPLDAAWFPSRMHAFIWRNWGLLTMDRLAMVLGSKPNDIIRVGRSLGLEPVPGLNDDQRRRACLTIIRRNWHLLPYEQLLALLGWSSAEMAYTLREDDFFFIKLGRLKPNAAALRWAEPDEAQQRRAEEIARVVREYFPGGALEGRDPLFSFVEALSQEPPTFSRPAPEDGKSPLRLGYSYFALYGDPLLEPALDPYPDGYLTRLAAVGVNAVWLQGVLARLSPLPWKKEENIERRRAALHDLVERAARHGVKIFLYLNEPRSLPANSEVFARRPEWRGVVEGEFRALCTSAPEVRNALREGVAALCRSTPGLGGFLTITGSENLTNCWSHGRGAECSSCLGRRPAEVIAEVNATFLEGIRDASGQQRLLAWDWGWADEWAVEAIERLPSGAELMSVSEWGRPIERGGVKTTVGEYCLSVIGPGPRAMRHWAAAKKRGIPVVAKLQLGVSWEFAAAPYLPVLENITRHAATLRDLGVDNLMLGWTLGGYPSPNLEAVAEIAGGGTLETLAARRHGKTHSTAVAAFWRDCSAAFREFPFNGGTVYFAPLQTGPANPLWAAPTGYRAAMVGIPYDDLESWRSVYPAEILAAQLEKVASGFESALAKIRAGPEPPQSLAEELSFVEAAAIHFASVANQSRFILARRSDDSNARRRFIHAETRLAVRLHALQSRDARIGFESSNEYFYTPLDLVEKVVNCRWLSSRLDADKPVANGPK